VEGIIKVVAEAVAVAATVGGAVGVGVVVGGVDGTGEGENGPATGEETPTIITIMVVKGNKRRASSSPASWKTPGCLCCGRMSGTSSKSRSVAPQQICPTQGRHRTYKRQ
jgi:hypothetical protein